MTTQIAAASERPIRVAWDAKDLRLAATLALQAHGAEIHTFLIWRLRSRSEAAEVFSMFAEDLWSGLPQFGWRCKLRTWLYVLARNAAQRYASAPHRRMERRGAFIGDSQLSAMVAQITTRSVVYQETEVKSRVRALRERLAPLDQQLLVLRVDRGLAWRELAIALSGDTQLEGSSLDREAARLRKRFERIKADLRQWVQNEQEPTCVQDV